MSHVYTTPRNSAMRMEGKPKPPQAYAAPMEERLAARSNARMEEIRLMYLGLIMEGKTARVACRTIADCLQTTVSSVSGIVKRLKKENKLKTVACTEAQPALAPESRAHIIKRRDELASEGKTEFETSEIIAGELGLAQKFVWNKIQLLIREGSIPQKRELSRARRRSRSFQIAEHEKREKLRKERQVKKKEGKPPRPAEPHDKAIEELLAQSRNVREGIFVPLNPPAISEGRVSGVMRFAKSRIGGLPRFRNDKQGEETKCYFSLAKTIVIEAQARGGAIFFRKSSIPAILFAAAMEKGSDSEAMGEIGALAREISDNRHLFPKAAPSWLELKIWVARAFCSENVDGGANFGRIQKIEEEIPFSRLAKFFGHTHKTYLETRFRETEPGSPADLASWRRHSSLYL